MNLSSKQGQYKNIITGLINVRKKDLDSDIVIIGSYENFKGLKREKNLSKNLINEREIMKN